MSHLSSILHSSQRPSLHRTLANEKSSTSYTVLDRPLPNFQTGEGRTDFNIILESFLECIAVFW
jgi:hypothetical protein